MGLLIVPKKRPPGRPPFEVTDEVCAEVETLAGRGLTMRQIASMLGLSERTVYKKATENAQFMQAIEGGRASGINTIANALFERAEAGDVQAIRYYLNNRGREEWAERHELGISGNLPVIEVKMTGFKKAKQK